MRVTYRRDVRFDENCFTYNPSQTDSVTLREQDQQAETPTNVCEEAVGEREEPEVPVLDERADPPPRAQRLQVQPKRYVIDEIYIAEMPVVHSTFSAVSVPEPTSMKEAMTSEHRTQWKCAAQEEYDSLPEHETWRLCDLPSGRKTVGSKWVFKVKYGESGENRLKCRLVAQGFSQILGVDYNETFAPGAHFGTIQGLVSLGVQRGLAIHQMDVGTAFLNGVLHEDIYMKQPERFEAPGKEHQVCHLQKSLYGLKQSPRCWYEQLSPQLDSTGFKHSRADPCVFYKWENGNLTVITIYVDDLQWPT